MGRLRLPDGGRVLDLGCGSGGSFPLLVKAVGENGQVIGVDISAQSCINARRRVTGNAWRNVEVVEAPADRAELPGLFDGALMFAAPDVFASERALENILPRIKPGGRLALFGAKLSDGKLGAPLNGFFLFMCRHLSPASPLPDAAPWTMLATHLEDVEVEELFFGSMFLASGTLK